MIWKRHKNDDHWFMIFNNREKKNVTTVYIVDYCTMWHNLQRDCHSPGIKSMGCPRLCSSNNQKIFSVSHSLKNDFIFFIKICKKRHINAINGTLLQLAYHQFLKGYKKKVTQGQMKRRSPQHSDNSHSLNSF